MTVISAEVCDGNFTRSTDAHQLAQAAAHSDSRCRRCRQDHLRRRRQCPGIRADRGRAGHPGDVALSAGAHLRGCDRGPGRRSTPRSHDFKTVVVDSVDWLEPLVWAKACRDNGWASIEDAGYGKGYVAALNLWRQYIDGLNALRDDRGMTVIQIAHTDIKRFDSPEHDPYDRYVIKLHTRAAALLQEHSDVVLFANYRISTVKADVGFNKKVNRAMGSGERVIHTAERPAFLAKNRYGLPETLPLDWQASSRPCPTRCSPLISPSQTTPTRT